MRHIVYVILSVLSLFAYWGITDAYCDDFRPIHMEPAVIIDYDELTVNLKATYYGGGGVAAHQKLYVKFLELGNRPQTREGIIGIPTVAIYDEDELPNAVSTDVETDDQGHAVIFATLKPGRYQLVISYDGLEGTGWQPLRVPVTVNSNSSSCMIRPVVNTEKDQKLFKVGTEIPFDITFRSSCKGQESIKLSVEIDDGDEITLIPLEPYEMKFKYKSERKGTYPVNIKVKLDNPYENVRNILSYSIIHPKPSMVRIGAGYLFHSFDETIYYYDELVKPEAEIIDQFFTTKVRYQHIDEARNFPLTDIKLRLCVPDTDDCFIAERDFSVFTVAFRVPTSKTGPMKPTLFIGDTPYDIPLPEITLPPKTARNVTGISVLALICLTIVVILGRKRRARSAKLPLLPRDYEVNDDTLCKEFIRRCFDVVSRQYCFCGIDWKTDTVETYYQAQAVEAAVRNNHAFEKYCFYIHSQLRRDSYSLEDLKNVRQKSLELIK